jgi:hypothetical protein
MPAFLGLGPDNPVTWCNFYRKGGFKTLLGTAGAYFGILAGLIVLTVQVNPRAAASTYGGWTGGLLALQFLFVVIIGAGRVSNAIRGDASYWMIESLRMMPLASGHAVVGYLSAAAASMAGFFAATVVLGLIVTALAEYPAGRWLAANLILVAFAVFVWTVAAFLAFVVKNATVVMVGASLVGMFGNAGVLLVAPGLVVLAGPLVGGTIFNLRTAQTEFAAPLVLSVAAQFLVGAIFFAGAARKYRRPDALALGAWLGLGLLVTFVAISLLSILRPEGLQPAFLAREFRNVDPAVPFCGSGVLAMLVSLIPLCNFARLHVGWVKGVPDDATARRTVPPLVPAALIVTGALALMLLAHPYRLPAVRAACVVAGFFGFCASVIFVAAWFYRAVDNAKVILAIWLGGYCLAPLVADFVRHRMSDESYYDPVLARAATFSPVGLVIESASQPRADLRAGAVFHCLIPLLPAALYLRRRRSSGQNRTIHE